MGILPPFPLHMGGQAWSLDGASFPLSSSWWVATRRRRVLLHARNQEEGVLHMWLPRKVSFFHGFQEIKKAFLDFKDSSSLVRARSLDHGEKVSQDHEIKKGFLDCQKERRVLLIWGFLDWFLNCSRKGSRNQEKVLLCMNLDL